MLWYSCNNSNTKLVRRRQQATGSNRKHNKASGSVQKLPEFPESLRKPQQASERHNIKIIINKQTNTVALKSQVNSKISTVEKHC